MVLAYGLEWRKHTQFALSIRSSSPIMLSSNYASELLDQSGLFLLGLEVAFVKALFVGDTFDEFFRRCVTLR